MARYKVPSQAASGADSFSDDLVGNQITEGSSLMTGTNFTIEKTIPERDTKEFRTQPFSDFLTLDDVIDEKSTIDGESTDTDKDIKFNNDKKNADRSLYGSLRQRVGVSVTNIISKYPAAIQVNSSLVGANNNTAESIVYSNQTNTTEFKVLYTLIYNPLDVILKEPKSNVLPETDNSIRNFYSSYTKYILDLSGITYNIVGYTEPNSSNKITLRVDGNCFNGYTAFTENYIIRPNDGIVEKFYDGLDDLERVLINRESNPKFNAAFNIPRDTNNGYTTETVTEYINWPLSDDGWNIEIIGLDYEYYVDKLSVLAEQIDNYKSNLIIRFLTSPQLYEFDTDEKKIESVFQIYGQSFDSVKKFIDNIAYMRNVSYDGINNVPDILLKNLAETLGLSTINLFTEKTLEEALYTRHDTQYAGVSLGTNLIEAEYEFYRRLLVNLAFLYKSKGTRTAIEFFLKFIGAPEPMIRLDEYIYRVDGALPSQTVEDDIRDAIQGTVISNVMTYDEITSGYTLTQITGSTSLSREEYPVDEDTGLPRGIEYDDGTMFFQKGAGWYKQTLNHRSSDMIDYENSNLTGRTKVIKTKAKPFTYGEDYFDVYRSLPGLNYGFNLSSDIDNEKTELVEDENTSRLTLNRKNINVFLSADRAIDYDIYRKSRDLSLSFGTLTPQTGVTFAEFLNNISNDIITNSHVIKYQNTYESLLGIYRAYQQQDVLFNPYNYISVTEFINRLSPYWIDIIEQFIPATTLWIGGNLIGNSIFNRSKYKHKRPLGPTAYIEILYPDFETVIVEDLRTFIGGGTVDGVSYSDYFRGLTSFSGVSYLIALDINGTVYSEQTTNLKTFTGFTPTSACTRLASDTETIPLICDYEGNTLFSDANAIQIMKIEWKGIVDLLVADITANSEYIVTATYCTNSDGVEYVAFTVTPKEYNSHAVESFDYYFTPSYVISHDDTNMEAVVYRANALVFSGDTICELHSDITIRTANGPMSTIVGDEGGNNMPAYIQADCQEPINILEWVPNCEYHIHNFSETSSLDLILSDASNTEVHMRIDGLQYQVTEWEPGVTGFTSFPIVEYRPGYSYGIKRGTYVLKVLSGDVPSTYQELNTAIVNGDIVEELVENILSGDTLLSMELKSPSQLTASQFQSVPVNGYQFAFNYTFVRIEDIVCFSSVKTYLINGEFKVLPTSKVLVYSEIECIPSNFIFKHPEDLYIRTTGSTSVEYLITETGFPIEVTSVEFTNCNVHDIYYQLNISGDSISVVLFDGMSIGNDKLIISYIEEEIGVLNFDLYQYCIDLAHGIDEDNVINTQTQRLSTYTGWCYNGVEPTPSATPSLTPSITPTPAVSTTPSISVSFTISLTPTATPSITPSVSFSQTPTSTPSISLSRTPSASLNLSATPTISITSSITPSITPTLTPSITLSRTPSITLSTTPSISTSVTPPITQSITPTITPTITPSISLSRTPSITMSISFSNTPTTTPSISLSRTPTQTPSISFSQTPTQTPSISFSQTPTTSITRTPTPSTSIPMYFACSSFGLGLSRLTGGYFLTVGALTGTTAPTDYMIEWRLNSNLGTTIFTSGSRFAYDPAIQAEHPFYDEVVEAGTLYPVISRLTIAGYTYTPTYEPGYRLSPDLMTCLPSQIITAINCNSTLGSDPYNVYPFNLTYRNSTDGGINKSRVLRFNLTGDTNDYLGIEFNAYDVAEQVKFYYCTSAGGTGTLFENWVHGNYYTGNTYLFTLPSSLPLIYTDGNGLYPINYPINPRIAYRGYPNCNPLRFIVPLTGFTWASGDYLRIEIIGSVYEPSVTNTNWDIRFNCVSDSNMLCAYNVDSEVNKIVSTPIMVYSGDPTCVYEVQYDTLTTYTPPNRSLPDTPWMHKYLTYYNLQSGNVLGDFSTNPVKIRAAWNTTCYTYALTANTGYDACMNLSPGQTITITKDTNIITFTFTDIADFNKAQIDYVAMTGSSAWTTWSSYSNTVGDYYGYWRIRTIDADSCGDSITNYWWYFFRTSPVTFNAISRTMTIGFVIPTNNITYTTCDSTYSVVANTISTLVNTRDYVISSGSLVTSCRTEGLIYAWYCHAISVQTNPTDPRFYMTLIEDVFVHGLCDLSAYGFCKGGYSGYPNAWALFREYDRIRFMDTSSHEARMANWCLERKIGLRTDICTDFDTNDWETVYCSVPPSPSVTPLIFYYNVNMFSCSFGVCGTLLSNNNIQTSVPLTIGKWYVETAGDVVFNVLSTAALGTLMTPISGPYDTCSDACILPTPTPSVTPTITRTRPATPSITTSISLSRTPTTTPSISLSQTPTTTPSISFSRTPSITPSISFSRTPSITLTITPSITKSTGISQTPSITITPSITHTPAPPGDLPTVVTTAFSSIVPYYTDDLNDNLLFSGYSGGNVISEGTSPVTYRGIVWATHTNPIVNSTDYTLINGSGPGIFNSLPSLMTPGSVWHVRAYAMNSSGVAYGQNELYTTSTHQEMGYAYSDGSCISWTSATNSITHDVIHNANIPAGRLIWGVVAGYMSGNINFSVNTSNNFVHDPMGTATKDYINSCYFYGISLGGTLDRLEFTCQFNSNITVHYYIIDQYYTPLSAFDVSVFATDYAAGHFHHSMPTPYPDDNLVENDIWLAFAAYDGSGLTNLELGSVYSLKYTDYKQTEATSHASMVSCEFPWHGSQISSTLDWDFIPGGTSIDHISFLVRVRGSGVAVSPSVTPSRVSPSITPSITMSKSITPSHTPTVTPTPVREAVNLSNNTISSLYITQLWIGGVQQYPTPSLPYGPTQSGALLWDGTFTGTIIVVIDGSTGTDVHMDLTDSSGTVWTTNIPASSSFPYNVPHYGRQIYGNIPITITLSNGLSPSPTPSISITPSITHTRGLTPTPSPSIVQDSIFVDPSDLRFDANGFPYYGDFTVVTSSGADYGHWTAAINSDPNNMITSYTTTGYDGDSCVVGVAYTYGNYASTAVIRLTCGTAITDITICRDGIAEYCA